MGNSFGHSFRITTWGESHGDAVGVVIDGCPPLLELSEADIQPDLDRRRPGQSALTTQRKEPDAVQILSGVFEGKTLGTPIQIQVMSRDKKSKDYEHLKAIYRPSHADYTYAAKYGIRNWQGGGRASARETVGRVAAGAVAKKLLATLCEAEVVAFVSQVADIQAKLEPETVQLEDVEANAVRCPDTAAAEAMIARIDAARKAGDSLGGVVGCVVRGCPVGLGEPVFDKLEADLAKALLSIPACRGFEVGSGFAGVSMTGSEHNDAFYNDGAAIRTRTNHSGGIQGGISNGEPILLKAAFKPTSTIMKPQQTVDVAGNEVTFRGKGRHDPCVLPRAVPIVEAMVALVLVDHLLRHRGQVGS